MTPVVLTRPHTHAGTLYPPGARLAVDATTAEWLIANDVATAEPASGDPNQDQKPLPRKDPKP